jgi:hypothetical protein
VENLQGFLSFTPTIKEFLLMANPSKHQFEAGPPIKSLPEGDGPVTTLHEHLATWSAGDQTRRPIAETIAAIASAAAELATVIAQGPLAGDVGRILGASADGDGQKALDVYANTLLTEHLRAAPVAAVVSDPSFPSRLKLT